MTAIQHVFKRGSVYWWRRRLPIGTGVRARVRLELSLDTKERELARRIAPEVARASDHLLTALKAKMISTDDAKRILIQIARGTATISIPSPPVATRGKRAGARAPRPGPVKAERE